MSLKSNRWVAENLRYHCMLSDAKFLPCKIYLPCFFIQEFNSNLLPLNAVTNCISLRSVVCWCFIKAYIIRLFQCTDLNWRLQEWTNEQSNFLWLTGRGGHPSLLGFTPGCQPLCHCASASHWILQKEIPKKSLELKEKIKKPLVLRYKVAAISLSSILVESDYQNLEKLTMDFSFKTNSEWNTITL